MRPLSQHPLNFELIATCAAQMVLLEVHLYRALLVATRVPRRSPLFTFPFLDEGEVLVSILHFSASVISFRESVACQNKFF